MIWLGMSKGSTVCNEFIESNKNPRLNGTAAINSMTNDTTGCKNTTGPNLTTGSHDTGKKTAELKFKWVDYTWSYLFVTEPITSMGSILPFGPMWSNVTDGQIEPSRWMDPVGKIVVKLKGPQGYDTIGSPSFSKLSHPSASFSPFK